ncbi:FAD/NAD-binding domain-containing protein [Sanghuangporus baumii]|uniref:FAD/NAD-binding domain-containing protein n=1 Tax=Sanghuangporus baumii TaxID=108892 RepID=A0A9Q5N8C7_SANBA|nr:FAD/NAD-binding domain-containing protein [Sanghuangporus baumii]
MSGLIRTRSGLSDSIAGQAVDMFEKWGTEGGKQVLKEKNLAASKHPWRLIEHPGAAEPEPRKRVRVGGTVDDDTCAFSEDCDLDPSQDDRELASPDGNPLNERNLYSLEAYFSDQTSPTHIPLPACITGFSNQFRVPTSPEGPIGCPRKGEVKRGNAAAGRSYRSPFRFFFSFVGTMTVENVVVLGGAYAGAHAYQLLARGLEENFRVILIDRNTHANHVYAFARYAVLPGHEHKCFIPYKGVLQPIKASDPAPPPSPRHLILHAKVICFTPHEVTIDRTFPELGFDSAVIPYRFAVYALGSHLPASIDFWGGNSNAIGKEPVPGKIEDKGAKKKKEYDGTKPEGIDWFKHCQERIRSADTVLCVGGGALGIQFATDIKSVYPEKHVTLLHSRTRLLPRFMRELHTEVLKSVEDLSVDLILGERLDMASTLPENTKYNERGQRIVWTEKGREIAADLILLCTGQLPNTELLAEMSPVSINPNSKLAYVLPSMQLSVTPPPASELDNDIKQLKLDDAPTPPPAPKAASPPPASTTQAASGAPRLDRHAPVPLKVKVSELPDTPYPHIFVTGDCADAFGATNAGHCAYWQAEIASRNIILLAQRENEMEASVTTADVKSENSENSESRKNDDDFELEAYTPTPPAIKVSLGVGRRSAYQIHGMVGRKDVPEADDLDASMAWAFFGLLDAKPEDMYQ